MGPNLREKNPEVSLFDRARYQLKKTTEEYFKDPVHYLSYGFLGLTLSGLFLGMKFSWEYYGILIILWGVKLYQLSTENKVVKKDKKSNK